VGTLYSLHTQRTQNREVSTIGQHLHSISAAILAGGFGTRLRSVVADRPKPLAPIHGRPFLTYLLDQIVATGVREAVLCTGFMGEAVRDALGESFGPLRLHYSQEQTALGTGGALRLALPLINAETVLIMNGDSYCAFDPVAFQTYHVDRGALITMLMTEVPDTVRYGQVELDADGRVTRFREKTSGSGPGWINAGVYLMARRILHDIPEGRPISLERDVFPALIGRGLYGYAGGGRFLDIGTPESYEQAAHFFAPLAPGGSH
jgi:D-glycero-alpha-D-manno-heptose 1-phosphate guanylyltransferase